MPACPICGLGERCRNHWIATEDANGEVAFQTGVMTASEDNLILLRNKLKNPPLRELLQRIGIEPTWAEDGARRLAYLPWPLDLRAAVHRALFPNGAPGAAPAPVEALNIETDRIEELRLLQVWLDLENCLPDELQYYAKFDLTMAQRAPVKFLYIGLLWAEGANWQERLKADDLDLANAMAEHFLEEALIRPLRKRFAGHTVGLLFESDMADRQFAEEVVLSLPATGTEPARELHLGEEMEALIHARGLQPALRDALLQLTAAEPESLQ